MSFSEDIPARFRAVGWHVQEIDGMDTDQVRAALAAAQAETERPSLICARTVIGFGSPKADTFGVHGSPLGAEGVTKTKEALGYPLEPAFYVSDNVAAYFRAAGERGAEKDAEWQTGLPRLCGGGPGSGDGAHARLGPASCRTAGTATCRRWEPGSKPISTRKASGEVINAFAPKVPNFIGGSADLNPSTNTAMKGAGDFGSPAAVLDPSAEQGLSGGDWGYAGRNIHFGIREHAMGSAANGMAAHGGVIPFTATFLVFADYMRPPIRLAALSDLKVIFVFTHDSIAVGEDGPTHQPVEQLVSLRAIPKLVTIRPADANETADAWRVAMTLVGPCVLVFSRQDLPVLDRSGAWGTVADGAYIISGRGGRPGRRAHRHRIGGRPRGARRRAARRAWLARPGGQHALLGAVRPAGRYLSRARPRSGRDASRRRRGGRHPGLGALRRRAWRRRRYRSLRRIRSGRRSAEALRVHPAARRGDRAARPRPG